MNLTPTLQGEASPIVERTVEHWNQDYKQSQAPSNMEELGELVQDLRDNPPTSPADILPLATPTVYAEAAPMETELPKELLTPTPLVPHCGCRDCCWDIQAILNPC